MQNPLSQIRQDKMEINMQLPTLQPGRMVILGASARLEVDSYGFGVQDTEDLRRPIFLLKMRYWQHMKASELFWKWLVVKHSSFRYNDCLCWAGCSKGESYVHILQLLLCGLSGSHLLQ